MCAVSVTGRDGEGYPGIICMFDAPLFLFILFVHFLLLAVGLGQITIRSPSIAPIRSARLLAGIQALITFRV